jgi:hypothetical protein
MRQTAVQRERSKAVAYILARAAEGERVLKQRGTAEEASIFKRRVRAIADEIEQGLHL